MVTICLVVASCGSVAETTADTTTTTGATTTTIDRGAELADKLEVFRVACSDSGDGSLDAVWVDVIPADRGKLGTTYIQADGTSAIVAGVVTCFDEAADLVDSLGFPATVESKIMASTSRDQPQTVMSPDGWTLQWQVKAEGSFGALTLFIDPS